MLRYKSGTAIIRSLVVGSHIFQLTNYFTILWMFIYRQQPYRLQLGIFNYCLKSRHTMILWNGLHEITASGQMMAVVALGLITHYILAMSL